jgi:uncharacterized protein (UPF0264 family)
MTRLLASVQDEREAQIALEGGADIVDFKDARKGALGTLDPRIVTGALLRLNGHVLTSATAGDCPLDPAVIVPAVLRTGAIGVDYVKIGLLPGPDLTVCIQALAPPATQYRIVAVFFADRGVPQEAFVHLRNAGFAGAMLDTYDKRGGGLRHHMSDRALRSFVRSACELELHTGLAGSLTIEDIDALTGLEPDLLGLRGALCEASDRGSALSADRLRQARLALDQARVRRPEACGLSPK